MPTTYKAIYHTKELAMRAAYYREKTTGVKQGMYMKSGRGGAVWRVVEATRKHPGHGWIDAGWKRYHIPERDITNYPIT